MKKFWNLFFDYWQKPMFCIMDNELNEQNLIKGYNLNGKRGIWWEIKNFRWETNRSIYKFLIEKVNK